MRIFQRHLDSAFVLLCLLMNSKVSLGLEVAGARDARKLSFARKVFISRSTQDTFGVFHVLVDLINVPSSTFSLERVTLRVVGILLLSRLLATHSERGDNERRLLRGPSRRSVAPLTDRHMCNDTRMTLRSKTRLVRKQKVSTLQYDHSFRG